MLHTGSCPSPGYKLVWRTWSPLKVRIFLWLALRRRHWTADRRRRHGLVASPECYLCDQEEETIDHIIATCSYSREVWFLVLQAIGCNVPPAAPTTLKWWRRVRANFNGDRRKGIDTLFALVSWQLWKERNARCFRGATTSTGDTMQIIKSEGERWVQAGAEGLRALIGN
jgi:hypothetical protein